MSQKYEVPSEPFQLITQRFRPGGIGRHISWLLLQAAAETGTMTLATLLAARMFGPVSWGQLGILLAGVQLVSTIGDGFFPTIIRFVSEARAKGNPDAPHIGWRCMWISVGTLLLISAILAGAALAVFSSQVTALWVGLAMLLAVSRGWRASFDGIYRGMQYFRTPAVAGSVCVAATAGGILYFAAHGYRVSAYLGVMLVGMVANCLWLAVAYHGRYGRADARKASAASAMQSDQAGEAVDGGSAPNLDSGDYTARAYLKYSLPLALRGIWTFLFLKINIWMLGAMASEYDAGQFRLTDQFLTIPSLLLSSLLLAVAPRIVAAQVGGKYSLELLLSRVYGLVLVLTIPLALFFWFNEPIITWLFPDFAPASRMLTYFAPAMVVMGLGFAASIVPVQAGKPGLALGITVVSGIANVLMAYIGFKVGGVYGMAIGTAIVHFLTYALGVVVTHWAFGLRFRVRFS
jgi:O-antigen/teichoic acid export membrane protein